MAKKKTNISIGFATFAFAAAALSSGIISLKSSSLTNITYLEEFSKSKKLSFLDYSSDEKKSYQNKNVPYILETSSTTSMREVANSSSYFGHNHTMVVDMKYEEFTPSFISRLKSCIYEKPAEFGETVDYIELFKSVRNDKNYKSFIQSLENSDELKLSVIVLLSFVKFNDTFDFERNFIVEQLFSSDLQYQENALITISLWNNKELLLRIRDAKIENRFLQKRLDKIIARLN